jgi:NEDD8-activating enzyme E1 regulatory subunit
MELQQLLESSPIFTIIMYSHPIRPDDLQVIQSYGQTHKTPLVAMHSVGFYSYFRIHLPGTFPIVDTHPDDTATTDLRLLAPWPELSDFARELTADIDNLNDHEHGHLPYIVILLHYLEKWRDAHHGSFPSNYKEKVEFRQMVSNASRRDNAEGGEENFDEAVAAVLRNVEKPSLPSGLREVFQYGREHKVGRQMQHMSPSPNHSRSPIEKVTKRSGRR